MVNANYFVYQYLPMNVIVKGHAAITCKILNPLLTAMGDKEGKLTNFCSSHTQTLPFQDTTVGMGLTFAASDKHTEVAHA